jgi:hypothetical protein
MLAPAWLSLAAGWPVPPAGLARRWHARDSGRRLRGESGVNAGCDLVGHRTEYRACTSQQARDLPQLPHLPVAPGASAAQVRGDPVSYVALEHDAPGILRELYGRWMPAHRVSSPPSCASRTCWLEDRFRSSAAGRRWASRGSSFARPRAARLLTVPSDTPSTPAASATE